MNIPTEYEDIIDSRDVIDALENMDPSDDGYSELLELAAQGQNVTDWEHGITLVRDSYFVDYAQELAEDCGMLRDSDVWPYTCIDWERAARELQYDYYPVEFNNVTYWAR